MNFPFGHSSMELGFWRRLVTSLVAGDRSPFYLFSIIPIITALSELDKHFGHLPIRHWLSFKTQPLRPLIRWWKEQGRGIEVVSEFEFLAALKEGFLPEKILINGPAKHHWLGKHAVRGLFVNFDSMAEAKALLPLAKKLKWHVGIRINTNEEFDPETPQFPTQFGFTPEEAVKTLKWLKRENVPIEIVHFHLRTNIKSHVIYERALDEVLEVCRAANFSPRYIDCGGGFPASKILTRSGKRVDAEFSLSKMAEVYARTLNKFPGAEEIWIENGRWLSARSGVLVVKILDVKERRGMRHLICDGGRTMNAMLSTWEQHELVSLPNRSGPKVLTTVVGPTCMAFDQLARRELPRSLRVGDHLIWLDAGAYHLPWETRFSHGLAAVFWHDGKNIRLVRERESFQNWWQQWK